MRAKVLHAALAVLAMSSWSARADVNTATNDSVMAEDTANRLLKNSPSARFSGRLLG